MLRAPIPVVAYTKVSPTTYAVAAPVAWRRNGFEYGIFFVNSGGVNTRFLRAGGLVEAVSRLGDDARVDPVMVARVTAAEGVYRRVRGSLWRLWLMRGLPRVTSEKPMWWVDRVWGIHVYIGEDGGLYAAVGDRMVPVVSWRHRRESGETLRRLGAEEYAHVVENTP